MQPVGVDGCPAGWFAVTRRGQGTLAFEVFPTVHELARHFTAPARIFIDVPIGLPWCAVPVRPCDRHARRILGRGRRSSVFPVPCRAALGSADRLEASAINFRELRRKIGVQTWAISPKIAEVDRFVRGPGRSRVHEIHPEICFWALAGGRPMRHAKRTAAGARERLDILLHREPEAHRLLEVAVSTTQRQDVQVDDVLDALAAFVTAEAPLADVGRVVGDPSNDETGLPMEMIHVAVS
jgi:predicted RNase H-like nuclease